MKALFPISIVSIILTSISCKNASNAEAFEKNWADCRQYYDKSTTYQKMQGNWKLIGDFCGYCTNSGYKITKEVVSISILLDSVTKTYKNGLLINTSKFSLINESSSSKNMFTFEKPYPHGNFYTDGYIEFCKNTLAFRRSYLDGDDFFFEKIQ